jgi:hypothetical protein
VLLDSVAFCRLDSPVGESLSALVVIYLYLTLARLRLDQKKHHRHGVLPVATIGSALVKALSFGSSCSCSLIISVVRLYLEQEKRTFDVVSPSARGASLLVSELPIRLFRRCLNSTQPRRGS